MEGRTRRLEGEVVLGIREVKKERSSLLKESKSISDPRVTELLSTGANRSL